MAHEEILDGQVDAGSPINEALMQDRIKNNDDDHETRVLALEADGTNWTSQLGTALSDTDMGTFTGSTLPDNDDARACLQALETAHDALDASLDVANIPTKDDNTFSHATEYATTSTSYTDVSNSSFLLGGTNNAGILDITYDFDGQRGFTTGTMTYGLNVNGVILDEVTLADNGYHSLELSYSGVAMLTVGAGPYTVKMQYKTTTGSSAAYCKNRVASAACL